MGKCCYYFSTQQQKNKNENKLKIREKKAPIKILENQKSTVSLTTDDW